MKFTGSIGPETTYEADVDSKLNVNLSLTRTGPNGDKETVGGSIPLETFLSMAALATKNGTVIMLEGAAAKALEAYVAAQPA